MEFNHPVPAVVKGAEKSWSRTDRWKLGNETRVASGGRLVAFRMIVLSHPPPTVWPPTPGSLTFLSPFPRALPVLLSSLFTHVTADPQAAGVDDICPLCQSLVSHFNSCTHIYKVHTCTCWHWNSWTGTNSPWHILTSQPAWSFWGVRGICSHAYLSRRMDVFFDDKIPEVSAVCHDSIPESELVFCFIFHRWVQQTCQ